MQKKHKLVVDCYEVPHPLFQSFLKNVSFVYFPIHVASFIIFLFVVIKFIYLLSSFFFPIIEFEFITWGQTHCKLNCAYFLYVF